MGSSPWWLPWVVYGPMGAAGLAWAKLAHGSAWSTQHAWSIALPAPWPMIVGLTLALTLAALTVGATRVLVSRAAWARRLHAEMRPVLLGLSASRIALLAGLSAVAEELLFRAALQPSLGLVPAALLFGAMHVGPRGARIAWPVWAASMGALFGLLYVASGSLLPPILAHALINYENMQYICNYDPTPLDIDRPRAHRDLEVPRTRKPSDA